MTYKFKAGDHVYYKGNASSEEDYGTVVEHEGSCYTKNLYGFNSVWVKWDSDGSTLYCEEDDLTFSDIPTKGSNKEQEAVMLLLSLGYTVSKNS